MAGKNLNSFGTRTELKVAGKKYSYHSLKTLAKISKKNLGRLPFSMQILLENLLRNEDGFAVSKKDVDAVLNWDSKAEPDTEIQFMPARIVLQDFTGVPAVADLAAMRAAMKRLGGDPSKINPLQPADLVIDHSVQVDYYGTKDALKKNADIEFERNRERYQFLRWGQKAFRNFRVVPPDTGIVHQVNVEFLSQVAMTGKVAGEKGEWVYPDTLVGTDSHTTMINGLGVVAWGVGGIEAEAAMLGQPITMLIPQVVGFRLKGKLPPGATATDLVLTVTHMLRKKGVVGKFVEFFGPGLANLSLADRATVSNMAPEYGATIGIFPVDGETTKYLKLTGRPELAKRVEAYFKAQNLWYNPKAKEPEYSDVLELDLAKIVPSLAGPARPQDHVKLTDAKSVFARELPNLYKKDAAPLNSGVTVPVTMTPPGAKKPAQFELAHGSVVIAAITSCTNTSNPVGLITAGLLAKNAVDKGLSVKPWVKTSLAPGSKVVVDYFKATKLLPYLEALNFHAVGFGCTTCIGNSGPLASEIVDAIEKNALVVGSVLSGNRNFEGRVHPNVRANFLASPALVVAYALAGSMNVDLTRDPIGFNKKGKPVFLKDIWPKKDQVLKLVAKSVTSRLFKKSYSSVFKGDKNWQGLKVPASDLYSWDNTSTYIKEPPFFGDMAREPKPVQDIRGGRVLALLGDSVTTDHISPAGDISTKWPAGIYLQSLGVSKSDFNSFGARRGNHEVMIRGTFGNTRLKNFIVPGSEGPVTKYFNGTAEQMPIYDASKKYQAAGVPLLILAGKEYGTGSSRDWAAKGTQLLGVRAVIAESFERIHRSNLIGMGVLPLQFQSGESAKSLGLDGSETFDLTGLANVSAGQTLSVTAHKADGSTKTFTVKVRIDTPNEAHYYKHGGILPYVLRQMLGAEA